MSDQMEGQSGSKGGAAGRQGNVRVQDVIQRLTILGLTEVEASVYVNLSMTGPLKASDLAASLQLHRSEAYRTLQRLTQRGFVSATLSRPTRFEAAPPEKLFRDLLAAEQARAELIRQARERLGEELVALRERPEEPAARTGVRIVQGRREVYRHLERLVQGAKHEVRGVSLHDNAVGMAELAGLLDEAQARAAEGVRFRAVLRRGAASAAQRELVAGLEGVEFRQVEASEVVRFVLVDDHDLVLWAVNDPSQRLSSERDVALLTDAPDLAALQATLFEALWAAAQPLGPVRSPDPTEGEGRSGGRDADGGRAA